MFMSQFFERMGTPNNIWPDEVVVLNPPVNFAGPRGDHTYDGPSTLNDWVQYHFRKPPANLSNDAAQLDWWSAYNTIFRWENKYPDKYKQLTAPEDYLKVALWNERTTLRYNTTWAFFGYTDNQCPLALKYANYLTSPEGCVELEASRGPVPTHINQFGVYTDELYKERHPRITNAKKETHSVWGKPTIAKKVVHRIPVKK
jgi:hypothetical protein